MHQKKKKKKSLRISMALSVSEFCENQWLDRSEKKCNNVPATAENCYTQTVPTRGTSRPLLQLLPLGTSFAAAPLAFFHCRFKPHVACPPPEPLNSPSPACSHHGRWDQPRPLAPKIHFPWESLRSWLHIPLPAGDRMGEPDGIIWE